MSATAILSVIAKPITEMFVKRSERKAAKDSLKAKAQMAKQSDATQITLTDAEWETAAQQKADTTWKDEYITVIVTWPYLGLFLGAVVLAYNGDARLLEGTMAGIRAVEALGIDVGFMMEVVVYGAIGIKIWRKI